MSLTSLLPPGTSLEEGIQLFTQLVGDTVVVNRAAVAASCWIAYDICLTFSQEVELVWKSQWSVPKLLYFCVRYYGLATSILYFAVNSSPDPPFGICRGWPFFEAFGAATAVCVIFGEGMFVLRLWVSYKGNKPVLAIIAFCFIAEIASSITVGIVEGITIPILPRPPGFPVPGCFTLAKVPLRNSLGAWIVNCSIAMIFFALMLYKFFTSESFRFELSNVHGNPLAKWSEIRHYSPLLYLLIRDGSMYFAMFFLSNVVNMILSIREEGRALEGMGVAWSIAVSSFASSRLLLNLRGFINGDDKSTLKTDKTTMRFEHEVSTSEQVVSGTTSSTEYKSEAAVSATSGISEV